MIYVDNALEVIKSSVTMRDVCNIEGIIVNRGGSAICPFHDDKRPSMRIYRDHFHCFACGAHGDVIDYYQLRYNMTFLEAIEAIVKLFDLPVIIEHDTSPERAAEILETSRRKAAERRKKAQKQKEKLDRYNALMDTWIMLDRWKMDYEPKPFEPVDPRYVRAVKEMPMIEGMLDALNMSKESG